MDKQGTRMRFSPEVRARAVRMVLDHEGEHGSRWAAIVSIADKIGCTAETLRLWVKKSARDGGGKAGLPGDMGERLKALERENRIVVSPMRQYSALAVIATGFAKLAMINLMLKRLTEPTPSPAT